MAGMAVYPQAKLLDGEIPWPVRPCMAVAAFARTVVSTGVLQVAGVAKVIKEPAAHPVGAGMFSGDIVATVGFGELVAGIAGAPFCTGDCIGGAVGRGDVNVTSNTEEDLGLQDAVDMTEVGFEPSQASILLASVSFVLHNDSTTCAMSLPALVSLQRRSTLPVILVHPSWLAHFVPCGAAVYVLFNELQIRVVANSAK